MSDCNSGNSDYWRYISTALVQLCISSSRGEMEEESACRVAGGVAFATDPVVDGCAGHSRPGKCSRGGV